MDRKKTENWTELDWLGSDRWLQLPAFKIKILQKKPVTTDRLQSIAIGFRYSSKIRTFWAYFKKNRARNARAMAKTICYGEIQLCTTSRSCIFWVLDNFYYHKNYIGSYYTLYSIFCSCFYIHWFLLVTTKMPKNQFLAVFFGPVHSIGLLGQPKTGCGCRSIQKRQKNWTRQDP